MDRTPVESSNLASVGYDAESAILEVEFHSGGIYQYLDVPEHVYEALMNSASKGSYLASDIKGQYRYVKV